MALFAQSNGIHFKEPWLLQPYRSAATSLRVTDAAAANQTSATTAFFTEMARRGLQDQTNWTADTYKTILSVSSGKGVVAAYVGCTAGGSETHTVEFTVDGVLTEIAVSGLASGERALLSASGIGTGSFFISSADYQLSYSETLDSNKQIFGALVNTTNIPPWYTFTLLGVPLLRFNQSLLIRAKHSASITNSTATAYSAVMYRLGL